jgi:uncharacterized membrane protein YhaH (DUF805 family)
MEWAILPFKKFAQFEGRSRRKEYWSFVLLNFGVAIAAAVLDLAIGARIVGALVTLAFLIPSISVGMRRLHDTGRSGWWLLIVLVPVIGIIALIVFFAQKGEAGENKYGPDPLIDTAAVFE